MSCPVPNGEVQIFHNSEPVPCETLALENLFASFQRNSGMHLRVQASTGFFWGRWSSWGVLHFLLHHHRQPSHPGRDSEQEIQMSIVTGILQEAIELPQKCPWASPWQDMPVPEEFFHWSVLPASFSSALSRFWPPPLLSSPCYSHCVIQRFPGEKGQCMHAGSLSNSVNFHHRTLALWCGSFIEVETGLVFRIFFHWFF